MNKITACLVLLLLLYVSSVSAQTDYTVKGNITEDYTSQKLVNATVLILNAKDSTLRKFTRTSADGSFSMNRLNKGKFILLVSYPGYADYVDNFALDSISAAHIFGNIGLKLKSRLLQDVIVKGKAAAIKIKGDTTEFNAAAYNIQPNAKVEDLLKQLPGIQVDKDGKITAQGQTVNKVLVDGEEFFGDDPTLVTKNLRADMVDKVQLYDKKSDQATFTGIDDGKKDKTLNIKLKEDKKNGYFGKAEAGVATNNYYNGQVLFNRFWGKQKFSAYGVLSNTGKTGLGWRDSQKYGGSDNVTAGDDGTFYISGSSDDLDNFNGQYNGQGRPTARTGGLHYDNKWNNDKHSINANYKIGSVTVDGAINTLTQNNLRDSSLNSSSVQNFHNYIFRQKLDGMYNFKIDTSSNLKISFDATLKHSETVNNYATRNQRADSTLLNTNNRRINNNTDGQVFNASAFYSKKFKKKGRTFSLNVSEAYNNSKAKGFLFSDINYYNIQGQPDSSRIINQYKLNNIRSSLFSSVATYSEPLSKKLALALNYGVIVNNSSADRKSFNESQPGSGIYSVFDSRYSSDYTLEQLINQGGFLLNYRSGKTVFNIGSKVGNVNFKQTNEYTGGVFRRNFVNWNPQARYSYRFSQQSSVNIDYNGNTQQPTVEQIQPVLVNNDPLNILLGNPGLTPSFTNRLNVNYNTYKVLSDQSLFFYGNFSFTSNPITSSVTTDPNAGKTVSQYVNLNRTPYNFYFGAYASRKIAGPEINVGLDINSDGSKSYTVSNGDVNAISLNDYNVSARISKYAQKKYDVSLSFGPNFTVGGSSLQRSINNNGHGWNGNGEFTVYLPGKLQIASDANYQYKSKTQTFDQSFSRVLLNASLTRTFFKSDNLKLVLSGNDLLNQNAGFSRNTSGNFITQTTYTTIRRYFMFSVVWDFNKMGGSAPKK